VILGTTKLAVVERNKEVALFQVCLLRHILYQKLLNEYFLLQGRVMTSLKPFGPGQLMEALALVAK